MKQFSISVDEEASEWIEGKADERGVSNSKVVRDAIETVRLTGLLQSDDVDPTTVEPLLDRIEKLEKRVQALESRADNRIDTDESENKDLIESFKRQMVGQPPTKDHGKEAAVRVFELLLSEGPLTTKYLRNQLSPEFEDNFSDADSMWNSYQRNLEKLDGIKKVEKGLWDANPSAVDTETGGLDNWDQS